jgi:hypothetical protein
MTSGSTPRTFSIEPGLVGCEQKPGRGRCNPERRRSAIDDERRSIGQREGMLAGIFRRPNPALGCIRNFTQREARWYNTKVLKAL